MTEMSGTSGTHSLAIVVTYFPDTAALLKLLGQLNKETDFIVIDNGTPNIQELIESIQVYERCIELRQLKENLGLARALNIGIEQALSLGCEYVFLFDQDSSLCDMFVNRMISAYRDALRLSDYAIAAVGPRIINPQTNRQTPFKLFNRFILRTDRLFNGSNSHFQADFLITSGTLLVLEHLQQIGDMKENYFIDNVDLEWCFRAKSLGFDIVGTDDAVLYHAIGERSENPLVRAGLMAQHNPSRTYYSSRNRTHLYRRSYSPLGWKLRDRIRFLIKASWLVVCSQDRILYWQSIRAGISDAKSLN